MIKLKCSVHAKKARRNVYVNRRGVNLRDISIPTVSLPLELRRLQVEHWIFLHGSKTLQVINDYLLY